MKTIEVSDEDYEVLMELSKELQTQETDCQAFPYYWNPSSYVERPNINNEGEYIYVLDDSCELQDLKSFADDNPKLYLDFLDNEHIEATVYKYDESLEYEWKEFLDGTVFDVEKEFYNYSIVSNDLVHESEHNFSLFKSDVQNFIDNNKHHLGERPHTYARTIWRMGKMSKLMSCLLRLNNEIDIELLPSEVRRFKEMK